MIEHPPVIGIWRWRIGGVVRSIIAPPPRRGMGASDLLANFAAYGHLGNGVVPWRCSPSSCGANPIERCPCNRGREFTPIPGVMPRESDRADGICAACGDELAIDADALPLVRYMPCVDCSRR